MQRTLTLTLLGLATVSAWVLPATAQYGPVGGYGSNFGSGSQFWGVQQQPPAPGTAAVIPTPPPAPTLTQDLEQLTLLIPTAPLQQLIVRYLLNDAQFQAFVRIINSQDAFIARMRIQSQPEVIGFVSWVRTQLMLSGGPLELESEEVLSLLNPTPYWANTVYGWQGFINEFLAYYPFGLIQAHINTKIAQNGIFAQFWARLQALKPVYERALQFPETQRIITQLQSAGIDTNQLDQLIRDQFGWVNLPPTTTVAPSTAAPVAAAPAAPAAPAVAAPVAGPAPAVVA